MAVNTVGPDWWLRKAKELRRLSGRLSEERYPALVGGIKQLARTIEQKYGQPPCGEDAAQEEE